MRMRQEDASGRGYAAEMRNTSATQAHQMEAILQLLEAMLAMQKLLAKLTHIVLTKALVIWPCNSRYPNYVSLGHGCLHV